MPTSVMRAKAVWGREEKSKARMKKKKINRIQNSPYRSVKRGNAKSVPFNCNPAPELEND